MRIVKRDEMLGMPEGTIYSESDEYAYNMLGLHWKGATTFFEDGTPSGWARFDLIDFNRSEVEKRDPEMATVMTGESLPYSPMDDNFACTDDCDAPFYLVFEEIDLRRLAGIIFDSLKAGKQPRVSAEKTMDYFKEGRSHE